MLTFPITPEFMRQAGCEPQYPAPPDAIRSILLVGAIPEYNGQTPYNEQIISAIDRRYLQAFLSKCAELGVNIAPDLRARVLNIEQDKQEDFLEPTKSFLTDAVLFCFVYYESELPNLGETCSAYSVSPHSYKPENWRQAIARSGAKLVANVTGLLSTSEPPIDDFLQGTVFKQTGHIKLAEEGRVVQFFKRNAPSL